MRKGPARGPRPSSIARVEGIDYVDLDQHLGYALRRAQVAAFDAFHRATAGAGVTPPRFTALVILNANPGITQSTLGQILGTARSGAMLLTDWLEGRGLAERRHRPDDGRAWGLYLTPKGGRVLETLRRRVRQQDRRFAGRLAGRERRELLRLLEKLAA
ncbi:MAG TPA: MarR family transcriptional regulator [Burkholderiales bacterium]|jgi:DNA-binding MarR family transcriptional regulator